MSNQSTCCVYHPSQEATSKCFRCNKYICENDVMAYDDNTYDYGMIRDCCIPCFAVLTEKDAEGIFSTIVAFIFLIVWAIVTTIIFWPLLVITIVIFYVIYNSRKQKLKAVTDAKIKFDQFVESLDTTSRQTYSSIYSITCSQCGSILDPSDIYCRTCGDETDY